jgi:hypothetical protein
VIAGGDPVWISVSVNDAAWKSSSLVNGVIPDYDVTSPTGHAIVLVGYRTTGAARQFLVHNSWGPTWGQNGYGWLSGAMIRKFTRAAYRVHVSDAKGAPSPTNPSGPSAGCADGQVRDSVLGSCAERCASGSAPAAGVCLPSLPGAPAIPGLPPVPWLPGQPPSAPPSCPRGQGVDPMTRQCANLCATGTPPIGGMCLPGFPGR